MTLEECRSCSHHILYRDGYVICGYWKTNEQRITNNGKSNSINIVSCPRENDLAINYKNDFPARWNKPREISKDL
jgi:hypothetical protein